MKRTKIRQEKKTNHPEDIRSKATQEIQELEGTAQESLSQKLPEQKVVFKADSIKSRAGRRGVHNLPDQTNPPMGFDPDKAFDSVFPFLKLPYLQPNTPEDVISFGSPEAGGYLDEKNKRIPLNAVFFGDNLHVLRALPSNCIDLIYIDPPFFSGRNYNQIWGDDNEVRTFQDIWEDGLPSYLVWLNARLWEMKRVLKNTGSIYVHCDWHASHYIKCELDKIFGYENLLNEIIWSYRTGGTSKETFSKKHDVILAYTKTSNYFFKVQYEKTYIPTLANRTFAKEELGAIIDKEGCPTCGLKGQWCKQSISRDVWDIQPLFRNSRERIGYPTQKPEELIRKIVLSSCPDNGIVADFFMGGGTTCAVAQKLNRKFIGCDISRVASSVALNRLINDAEEISGRTASGKAEKQTKKEKQVSLDLTIKAVPDIRVYYTGVIFPRKSGHNEEMVLV